MGFKFITQKDYQGARQLWQFDAEIRYDQFLELEDETIVSDVFVFVFFVGFGGFMFSVVL